jgi:hypothetical protein
MQMCQLLSSIHGAQSKNRKRKRARGLDPVGIASAAPTAAGTDMHRYRSCPKYLDYTASIGATATSSKYCEGGTKSNHQRTRNRLKFYLFQMPARMKNAPKTDTIKKESGIYETCMFTLQDM